MRPVDRTQRYVLDWNENGQAIGFAGKVLRRRVAALIKMSEVWPIDREWDSHDFRPFKVTWRYLQEDFDLYGHPNCWTFVFSKANACFNEWIRDVRSKYYLPYDNDAEQFKALDTRVDPYQFTGRMFYWETPQFMRISKINAENTRKRKMNHHLGSCPLAELKTIMTTENNGVAPKPLDLQIRAYNPPNPKKLIPDSSKILLTQISDMVDAAMEDVQQTNICSRSIEQIQYECIGRALNVKSKNKPTRLRGVGATSQKLAAERTTIFVEPHEDYKKRYQKMKNKVENTVNNYLSSVHLYLSKKFPDSDPLPAPLVAIFNSDDDSDDAKENSDNEDADGLD